MYIITNEDPASVEAALLLEALSNTLAKITGNSGVSSFDSNDVRGDRARFVVARTNAGTPIGCGAFRPINALIAEVKRMYAAPGTAGVGSAVLAHLEQEARNIGYAELWLETRRVNEQAVSFYQSRGYVRIPNFGKYARNVEAVCLGKALLA